MSGVFISYRREDCQALAGRVFDRLTQRFGKDRVFRDIDAIDPGAKFADVIAERIGSCDVLIALIGERWLEARDDKGRRRLDLPDDLVKVEIAEALAQDRLVIPVLIEHTRMPTREALPQELARLADRNAHSISDSRFDYDIDQLVRAIAKKSVLAAPANIRWGRYKWIATLIAAIVLGGVALALINQTKVVTSSSSLEASGVAAGTKPSEWTIRFDFDNGTLNRMAQMQLERIADWMKANPATIVILEGHVRFEEIGPAWTEAERRPDVATQHGYGLGEKRTAAVESYLRSRDIPPYRILRTTVGIDRPLGKGESREADALNGAVRVTVK